MKKLLFLFAVAFLMTSQFAVAQGCEEPEGDDDALKIFGFIQPQFNYHMTSPDAENTFKFKRARIGVTGNIPYDFSYYVVMENSAFVSATGSPYLLDAFISYKRFKWASVAFGSFKQPFGQEINTSCSGLHTVERSLASDYFVAPQRDMGIMLFGGNNKTCVKYSLALINGNKLGSKDNNTNKDFVGRLTILPLKFFGVEQFDLLRIGGSYRVGAPNATGDERSSWAGEMQLKWNELRFQAEYIFDKGDYVQGGGGCGATESISFGDERDGAYAMLMYKLPMNLEPIVKYEFMNTDLLNENSNIPYEIITFGFNYWFNDWTRLQANYRYRVEGSYEKDNDEIFIQLQVKF